MGIDVKSPGLRQMRSILSLGARTTGAFALDRSITQQAIMECLIPQQDPAIARANVAQIRKYYDRLSSDGVRQFFLLLASPEFDVDAASFDTALGDLKNAPRSRIWGERVISLQKALQSRRRSFFSMLNAMPDGLSFLIGMREILLDELGATSKSSPEREVLAGLDGELRDLLTTWLDIGFFDLVRVTWDSPASLLEKVMDYESVHKMRSWEDLRRRLADDRRIFSYFHPKLPGDPVVFVEVALVRGMSDNVLDIIEAPSAGLNPVYADTAIFYSINSSIKGLRNIALGNFLIKRVVSELNFHRPDIACYATLSPIPGFLKWLDGVLKAGTAESIRRETTPEELAVLENAVNCSRNADPSGLTDDAKPLLLAFCAHYLLRVKEDDGTRPANSVARFHLGNGALLERVNWRADLSGNGLRESAGLMINYHYVLSAIESNHLEFETNATVIASDKVIALLPTPSGRQ